MKNIEIKPIDKINGNVEYGILESKRFKPLQEQSFPLLTYSKVLEEVLVSSN